MSDVPHVNGSDEPVEEVEKATDFFVDVARLLDYAQQVGHKLLTIASGEPYGNGMDFMGLYLCDEQAQQAAEFAYDEWWVVPIRYHDYTGEQEFSPAIQNQVVNELPELLNAWNDDVHSIGTPFVVLVGHPHDRWGMRAYGLFKTATEAEEWADNTGAMSQYRVIPISPMGE